MSKEETKEFNKLLEKYKTVKIRIDLANKERKAIQKELNKIGKALDELEEKYS